MKHKQGTRSCMETEWGRCIFDTVPKMGRNDTATLHYP